MNDEHVFYRRHLPHWQPPGATIFLTWRLHGTLPDHVRRFLSWKKRKIEQNLERTDLTKREKALVKGKRMFGLVDDALHRRIDRVSWLGRENIAELVVESLFYHHGQLYDLHEFVILPNHVHVLLRPREKQEEENDRISFYKLGRINQSLKGYTARKSNAKLGRTGESFWQEESYDHWVRNDEEYNRIVRYIRMDPVRSDLVSHPGDWRWSSAHERYEERLEA